jgi:ribosomal-protein-alanine N-acetyltransferase
VTCKKILTPVRGCDTLSPVSPRAAGLADVAALVALDVLCFGRRAWSQRAWREVVTAPEWTTLVVEEEGRLAAAVVLLAQPPTAWLASIAVHPSRRGHRLGTALLRQALALARGHSVRWLALEVDAASPAVRLYRREGFGVQRRFREDGVERLEMARRLGGTR